MKFLYTARFLRTYGKLETDVQDDVESAIDAFKLDIHCTHLKLHKLQGNMKQYYAFSANYSYRIIIKMEKGVTYLMDVGDHNIYK